MRDAASGREDGGGQAQSAAARTDRSDYRRRPGGRPRRPDPPRLARAVRQSGREAGGEAMSERSLVLEWVMAPGTGKAVEKRANQKLRIEQTEGLQCVDFNCFN